MAMQRVKSGLEELESREEQFENKSEKEQLKGQPELRQVASAVAYREETSTTGDEEDVSMGYSFLSAEQLTTEPDLTQVAMVFDPVVDSGIESDLSDRDTSMEYSFLSPDNSFETLKAEPDSTQVAIPVATVVATDNTIAFSDVGVPKKYSGIPSTDSTFVKPKAEPALGQAASLVKNPTNDHSSDEDEDSSLSSDSSYDEELKEVEKKVEKELSGKKGFITAYINDGIKKVVIDVLQQDFDKLVEFSKDKLKDIMKNIYFQGQDPKWEFVTNRIVTSKYTVCKEGSIGLYAKGKVSEIEKEFFATVKHVLGSEGTDDNCETSDVGLNSSDEKKRKIYSVIKTYNDYFVDFALVEMDEELKQSAPELDRKARKLEGYYSQGSIPKDKKVYKTGIATTTTTGKVYSKATEFEMYEKYTGHVCIVHNVNEGFFCKEGDSGALVYSKNKAVGLVCGVNKNHQFPTERNGELHVEKGTSCMVVYLDSCVQALQEKYSSEIKDVRLYTCKTFTDEHHLQLLP